MPSFVNIMQSFWCKTLSKETEYGDIFDALFYKNVPFLVNMRRCPVFLDYTLSIKDQVNKDIKILRVVISKQGHVVDNKFRRIFKCNFRESLTLRRLTESKGIWLLVILMKKSPNGIKK